MEYSNKKKTKKLKINPESPRLVLDQNTEEISVDNMLEEQESYKNIHIKNCQLNSSNGVSFDSVYLSNIKGHDLYFERFAVNDTCFISCDFSMLEWRDSRFERVEFVDCKLTGMQLNKSNIKNTLFKNCQCQLTQFSSSKLSSVRFDNCFMGDSLMVESKLENTSLMNCQAQNLILQKNKFNNVDFRGSELEDIQLDFDLFYKSNITLDVNQAIYILQRFSKIQILAMNE